MVYPAEWLLSVTAEQVKRSPTEPRGLRCKPAVEEAADIVDKAPPTARRHVRGRASAVEPGEALGPGARNATVMLADRSALIPGFGPGLVRTRGGCSRVMSIFGGRSFGGPQNSWFSSKMLMISIRMSIFDLGTRKVLIIFAETDILSAASKVPIVPGSMGFFGQNCPFRLTILIDEFATAARLHRPMMLVVARARRRVGMSIFDAAGGAVLPKMLIESAQMSIFDGTQGFRGFLNFGRPKMLIVLHRPARVRARAEHFRQLDLRLPGLFDQQPRHRASAGVNNNPVTATLDASADRG